jgi:hypothetical protein
VEGHSVLSFFIVYNFLYLRLLFLSDSFAFFHKASPVNLEGFKSDFSLLLVNDQVVFVQPGKTKDDFLFPESSHIKLFLELLFANKKLEVDIGIDCSSFVFCSVHVVSLYWFVQIVYVEVFGIILVNEQTTSAAVDEGFDGLFIRANIDGNRDRILRDIGYCYRINVQVRRY